MTFSVPDGRYNRPIQGRGGAGVTTVYLDTLFALNALMDYLLLVCSARLAGEPLHRGRMALAAALGGAYAAAAVLPGMAWLTAPVCKLGAAVLLSAVGLGASRRLLRQTVIFLAVSCAFAGGVLAVSLLGGRGLALGHGIVCTGTDLKIVLLSSAICYALFTAVLRRAARHSALRGEVVRATLRFHGREVSLPTLVDTGNTLTDPVSGRPAIVVDAPAVAPLLDGDAPDLRELTAPAQALSRLNAGRWRGRFTLLPYRAVGVEHGLLLALRLDGASVDGRERGALLAALSPTPVSDGGAYRALVGGEV